MLKLRASAWGVPGGASWYRNDSEGVDDRLKWYGFEGKLRPFLQPMCRDVEVRVNDVSQERANFAQGSSAQVEVDRGVKKLSLELWRERAGAVLASSGTSVLGYVSISRSTICVPIPSLCREDATSKKTIWSPTSSRFGAPVWGLAARACQL